VASGALPSARPDAAHDAGEVLRALLDNVEHVREVTARVVAKVLEASPNVGILCTGREPLGWRAEVVLRLGPLPWDGQVDTHGTPQPAVQLFVERAAEAGATRLDNLAVIEKLCRRLDGLPLAIEMAAARASMLTPDDMLLGLDDAARSFVSRDPTLAERHRSLDHLLAWSDRLLSDTERSTMRRLAVFAAAFGYETAAAAAATAAPGESAARVGSRMLSHSSSRLESTCFTTARKKTAISSSS